MHSLFFFFCFQKFDIDKNKMVKYDKYFCKSLTEKSMIVDGMYYYSIGCGDI
jgi:hypothetical protein